MHSRAPWVVGPEGQSVHMAEGPLIAAVRFMGGRNEEGQANARLMAAAPELLAALRACLASLNVAFNADVGDIFGVDHNDAVDAMQMAEQAIAEATQP